MLTGSFFLNLPWWVETRTKVIFKFKDLNPGESGQWAKTANDIHPSSSPHWPDLQQVDKHIVDWNRMIGSWIWSHYLCSSCYQAYLLQTDLCLLKGHLMTSWPEYTNTEYTNNDHEWLWLGFLHKYQHNQWISLSCQLHLWKYTIWRSGEERTIILQLSLYLHTDIDNKSYDSKHATNFVCLHIKMLSSHDAATRVPPVTVETARFNK